MCQDDISTDPWDDFQGYKYRYFKALQRVTCFKTPHTPITLWNIHLKAMNFKTFRKDGKDYSGPSKQT